MTDNLNNHTHYKVLIGKQILGTKRSACQNKKEIYIRISMCL